jgi:hypothetical protein
MPTLIEDPTIIEAAGTKPKLIEEFVGRVNSATTGVSIARMRSPSGWVEPGQTPDFDVRAGQAVITNRGEWVQYSTPDAEGAEYIAVCLPAFSPDTVQRDE